AAKSAAPTARGAAAPSASWTSARRTARATFAIRSGVSGFQLLAEAKRLAHSQIQREVSRPSEEIGGHELLTGLGNGVEGGEPGVYDILRQRRTAGKRRAFVENGIAVDVLATDDVIWRA